MPPDGCIRVRVLPVLENRVGVARGREAAQLSDVERLGREHLAVEYCCRRHRSLERLQDEGPYLP